MSLPFCACRASGPFPRSAEREIPARKRRIAAATRVHHKTAAEERAAAQLRRSAPAPRVLRRTLPSKAESPAIIPLKKIFHPS